ncbi:MAG: hypothetical protein ABSH22_08470 [Tepidisphaeraceae bacterium]|jgi:hypothetical protein
MKRFAFLSVLFIAAAALGQTTRPDDSGAIGQPADQAPATGTAVPAVQSPTPEQVLNQMLQPADADRTAAITAGQAAASSGSSGVTETTDTGAILREGTDIVDRMGRLKKTADGTQEELVFESDGKAMMDAPMVILPNLVLMSMETAANQASHDLRFRVTGTVTEYRARNYILLEKFVVVQDKGENIQ